MPSVDVADGTSLFYHDIGDGRPVLFVHGMGLHSRIWEYQLPAMAEHYRVVAVDLRGHGRSDKPGEGYTFERLSRDLHELIVALDLDDVVLVGWSLGAYLGAKHMAFHGDRVGALVLTAAGVFHWAADPAVSASYDLDIDDALRRRREDRPAVEMEFVEGMFAGEVSRETAEWVWRMRLDTPLYALGPLYELFQGLDRDEWRALLGGIDVPTGAFHGRHDDSAPLAAAEHVATDVLPDGTFVPFEESGHVPFIEESGKFNDELRRFVG